jgi:uncharacterized cupin superfamily protein
MERVSVEDLPVEDLGRGIDRRSLTGPLGLSDAALNRYVLDPGEALAGSVHAHADQEEAFYVVEGEVAFEYGGDSAADRERTVLGAGEAVGFAPMEFQRGRNDGDGRAVVLAVGAPRDSDDVRIAEVPGYGDVVCPDCGLDHLRIPEDPDGGLVCPECGTRLRVE